MSTPRVVRSNAIEKLRRIFLEIFWSPDTSPSGNWSPNFSVFWATSLDFFLANSHPLILRRFVLIQIIELWACAELGQYLVIVRSDHGFILLAVKLREEQGGRIISSFALLPLRECVSGPQWPTAVTYFRLSIRQSCT